MLSFGTSLLTTESGAEWRRTARHLEAAGFDTLWCADHVGLMDPFAALTAAASVTERLRVGTYVLNIEFWNPLLLARAAATAGILSDGRFILGLGAGHNEEEFNQAGLTYPSAARRVERLTATVPALRRLLAGETVDDSTLGLAGAATGLPAVDVPLLVGGNGDRVLTLAGNEADRVGLVGFTSGTQRVHRNLSHWSWGGLANRIEQVKASANGRDVPIDLLIQKAVVTDDPTPVHEEFIAKGVSENHLDSPFLMVGSEAAVVDHLTCLHDDFGVSGVTIFGHDVDAFASAITRYRQSVPKR